MSEIVDNLAKKSFDCEFYTPVPKGYKAGRTKYLVVTGSVISGVGKGIFTSSMGSLLRCHGLNIAPIKFDGYLNCDAGTLNPFRHGEVFVLGDGTECDLDLGSYERFLNMDLTKDNYLTAGKIFREIIERERAGKYLGRDVQFIPHVTGEIKRFLRTLAIKRKADVVLVEVGGTAGDLENAYFIEAMRELAYEEGRKNVCFVNVTYILEPSSLGEFKSKAAQLGLRTLMQLGIQPDITVCRSEKPIPKSVREKISVFGNLPLERVINLPNCDNIYSVALDLKKKNIDKAVFDVLGIKARKNKDPILNFNNLRNFVRKIDNAENEVEVAIVGKYTHLHDSYLSIIKALEHCRAHLKTKIKIRWVESTDVEEGKVRAGDALRGVDGLIVPGAFGKRGAEGMIKCVQYARENKIPYLGLCFGLQVAVIEFCRNVLKIKKATSSELVPETKDPVIHLMKEQEGIKELGGNMRLGNYPAKIRKGTRVFGLYGKEDVVERHRHRWEVNPDYIERIENEGMTFSGRSPDGRLMEFLELEDHPYFVATQAHPEFTSKPLRPNPLFMGLVKAMINKKG